MLYKIINAVLFIKKRLEAAVNIIAYCLLIVLLIVVTIQICSRYIFNSPTVWTEELSRFLMIWIVFLGSSIVMRTDSHLSVNAIIILLPKKVQIWLYVIGNFLIFCFCATILFLSPKFLPTMARQYSVTLGLPMVVLYSPFVICLAFIFFDLLTRPLKLIAERHDLKTGSLRG